MDLSYSAEEITFRDEVREFLKENLSQHILDGTATSPAVFVEPDIGKEWHAALYKKGWYAYTWPKEYGGTGWTPTQRYIFEKECALARAPHLPVMGLKLLGPVVYNFGTNAQKAEILPRILSGEDYWCQGFSEPDSGSDLASLQTRAKRVGNQYIVNGSKIWTTFAQHSNRIFCLVRTDIEAKRQAGISFLLIDLDQPGVTVQPILTLAGDHEVNQVFFDNAVAPASYLIGEEGQGWSIAKFLLENERGGSCHAPELLAALEDVRGLSQQEPDGKGGLLSNDPQWRRRIAKVELSARALEMMELRILADIAEGRPAGPQTSVVKLVASKLRQDIDMLAFDMFGTVGLQLETARPLYGNNAPEAYFGRKAQLAAPRYLNSRAWTIFGGTNEVQANIIAKTVLGL